MWESGPKCCDFHAWIGLYQRTVTTRSCRLGGTISARMKRWQLSGSTAGCAIGLPAFGDGPALCRKRSRWSTPPLHCLPPTTSIEQRQNSPCHCLINTLRKVDVPSVRISVLVCAAHGRSGPRSLDRQCGRRIHTPSVRTYARSSILLRYAPAGCLSG